MPLSSAGPTTATGTTNITSCDFEAADLCGFTQQASGDQFDWTRHSGKTSSALTGPTNDHTYGTGAGHYMYTEASAPRHPGDKAVLNSFVVPATTQQTCVNFWYHMSGNQIGTLSAYLKVNGRNQQRIWSLKGNQGSAWKLASVSLPVVKQPWQVSFESVRGNGVMGDVAIDDFSISASGCGAGAYPGNCNFDNGLCSWTKDHSGDFDWISGTGQTNSHGTGPTGDHTSTRGKYMYIETSSPRKLNDRALLASEMLPGGSASCLHFYYNMYGANINTLRVWVQQNANSMQVPLFELKGQQSTTGSQWLRAQVPLPKQNDSFSIVFEGVRGTFALGDIALDDITFDNATTCTLSPSKATPQATAVTFRPLALTTAATTGKPLTTTTPPKPGAVSCDFSRDFCGWSQDTTDNFNWLRHAKGTPSASTGPTGDHTTGTGYYAYVETSTGRLNNKARLLSPSVQKPATTCFSFWYNMYGAHVNTLNFYVSNNNTMGALIWTLKGTQGPEWHFDQFTVPANTQKITVEALRGVGAQGDIAVDDFNITNGDCPQGQGTSLVGLSCNFESNNICGYTNDKEDFTWTRKIGRTTSGGTGPPNDHTYGTSRGHYMYTEASAPRRTGQKAGLISPQAAKGSYCLTFWYHMYGSRMGRLNIYTRIGNNRGSAVWSRASNQGNKWNVEQVTLNPTASWNLEFEGVRGTGIQSDIAIDDVNVTVGACPAPGECNFDTGSLCSYTNAKTGDVFDWTLQHGGTPSQGTGPSADHSTASTRGYYAFIESSKPRRRGDKAWLLSESLRKTGNSVHCFSFWYHMYGVSVGTLNVYLSTNGSLPGAIQWKLSGNQGGSWSQARFPVNSSADFSMVFEGVTGTGNLGDIAVDDITYTSGVCAFTPTKAVPPSLTTTTPSSTTTILTTTPVPATSLPGVFNCNFESNMCGWTQAKDDQFDWTRQSRPTGTTNTGPRSDHTSGRGNYVYIKTSAPRRTNDKARLLSPTQSGTGVKCVTFWYHMYGSQVKTLNMYVTGDANLGKAVWTKSGTQGNTWRKATVDINLGDANSKQYTVIFEGIRGNGVLGDIALDDISQRVGYCNSSGIEPGTCNFEDPKLCMFSGNSSGIEPGTCNFEDPKLCMFSGNSSGIEPGTCNFEDPKLCMFSGNSSGIEPGTCNFEDPKLCSYQQDHSGADKFDWTRQSRRTGTSNSGPTSDHTYGTSQGKRGEKRSKDAEHFLFM
ncbi:hypothetical protein V1264_003130 [Littorina saxatilis]|uniref:MAM domain-containing protein n=1 Tax=Littorina saxatilis TaxID=31220 RepID=A0AAN9G9L1_9CAEN